MGLGFRGTRVWGLGFIGIWVWCLGLGVYGLRV